MRWDKRRFFTSRALPDLHVEALVRPVTGEADYGAGIVKAFGKLMWLIIAASFMAHGQAWGAVALVALGVLQTFQTSRYLTYHYLRQGIDCRGTVGAKQFRLGYERSPSYRGHPYFLRCDGQRVHSDTFPREDLLSFLESCSDPLAANVVVHELEEQLETWRKVPRIVLFPQLVRVLALRLWWTEDTFDRKYGYFA